MKFCYHNSPKLRYLVLKGCMLGHGGSPGLTRANQNCSNGKKALNKLYKQGMCRILRFLALLGCMSEAIGYHSNHSISTGLHWLTTEGCPREMKKVTRV